MLAISITTLQIKNVDPMGPVKALKFLPGVPMADSPDFLTTFRPTLKALNRLAHRKTNSPAERAQFFAAKHALINAMAAAGAEFSVERQGSEFIFLHSDQLGVRIH